MSPDDPARDIAHSFGAAVSPANGAGPAARPLRWPVAVAAGLSALVGCWLLAVAAWVLPNRDPSHIVFWRVVAGVLLVYAALTLAHVSDAWARWLAWILAPASVVAIVTGAALVRGYASHAHAEGYLLLMGVLIGAHGALVLLDGVMSIGLRRVRRVS